MKSPNSRSFLDISTGHLRPQDIRNLEEYTGVSKEDEDKFLRVSPHVFGWIVSTGVMFHSNGAEGDQMVQERLRESGFSDEFFDLIKHASENDAPMIRFDADADYEPGFPVFEYGTDTVIDDGMETGSPAPKMG